MKHLLLALMVACAAQLYADKYVDATNGSDENPGTKDSPYQTIQKGIDNAGNYGVVWVAPGDYPVADKLTNTTSVKVWATNFEHPEKTRIIGAGDGRESCISFDHNTLLCGFTITNFFCSTATVVGNSAGRNIDLSNCVIRACVATSNYLVRARHHWNLQIRDCDVIDKSKLLHLVNTTYQFDGCLISNCTVKTSADLPTSYFDYAPSLLYGNGNVITRSKFVGNRIENANSTYWAYVVSPLWVDMRDCEFIDNIAINTAEGKAKNIAFSQGNSVYSNCVIVASTMPIVSGNISDKKNHYNVVISNCVGRFLITPVTNSERPSNFYNSLFVNNTNTMDTVSASDSMFMGSYYNCTFVNNADARSTANGILHSQLKVLANCVLHGNKPYDIGNLNHGVASNVLYGTVGPQLDKTKLHNCIQADNPKFNLGAKPELPYYALKKSSPAVNRGDATLNPLQFPTDLAGNPRINTEDGVGKLDLGCYEWYPTKGGLCIILR